MEGFAKLHKSRPDRFYDLNKNRQDASVQLHMRRKDDRKERFNLRRNIPVRDDKEKGSDRIVDKSVERKSALKRYLTNRERKRNKENENKKPPFVVGIPHHGSSPLLKDTLTVEADTFNRTQRDEDVPFHPPRIFSVKKLTTPHTPTVLKRSAQKTKESSQQIRCHLYSRLGRIPKEKKASNDSDELLATPLPSVESLGEQSSAYLGKGLKRKSKGVVKYYDVSEEALETPNAAQSDRFTHSTHGLNTYKQETSVDHDSGNIPDTFGAEFQRRRLERETARLTKLAQEWEAVSRQRVGNVGMPSCAVDEAYCVVGQTRLLISKKFKQFQELVEEYDGKNGSRTITSEDLNGFWDTMQLQVVDLIKRYDKLGKLMGKKLLNRTESMKKGSGRASKLELNSGATQGKAERSEAVALPPDGVRTPRRKSLRTLGKTPTPIKAVFCVVCQSPLSTLHRCVHGTKSKRTAVKETQQVADQLQTDLNAEQKTTKCKTVVSVQHEHDDQHINITDHSAAAADTSIFRTPLRRSGRKRTCVLDKSNDGKTGVCLKSDRLLRSANNQSATSVVFTSNNVVEKTYVKRPPTPFAKRGAGAGRPESLEQSWS